MGLFSAWKHWREQSILRRYAITDQTWQQTIQHSPILHKLGPQHEKRLRYLATLFLHDKDVQALGDLELDADKRTYIAAHACLLILELGLGFYSGWKEVNVYPSGFIAEHDEADDAGIIHHQRRALSGEAWGRGPVFLAWDDIRPDQQHGPGVILHEFSHKLDMLNGAANGMPPLHGNMERQRWTSEFTKAYNQLQQQLDHHAHTWLDPYAAQSPAEFFAVMTETFFLQAEHLRHSLPEIYSLLSDFYRQDPAQR